MTFYRFGDYGVSCGDEEFGFSSRREVTLLEFRVVKETPKGAWIETTFCGDKRFVRLDARKQYACPTVELARQSFIARKKRQIKILTKQLENAKEALTYAEVGAACGATRAADGTCTGDHRGVAPK
jgi:hypothetical protein